uniref:Uncharacterized protein n=1 Tax=Arundo donax TaxID=35708 RepID=A0A0A9HDF7_ARUDO
MSSSSVGWNRNPGITTSSSCASPQPSPSLQPPPPPPAAAAAAAPWPFSCLPLMASYCFCSFLSVALLRISICRCLACSLDRAGGSS